MSRPIYVPVFDSFFESSIMREELPVRFVMLALIRLAYRSGANGVVDVDPLIFAMSINLPPDVVDRAIKRLMEPDPSSTSPDEDGRRIVPVNPDRPFRGWKLVNWPKYRNILHRINDAARKRDEYHAAKDTTEISESLQKPPKPSGFRATRRDETRRYETKKKKGHALRAFVPPSIVEVQTLITEKGYGFDAEAFVAYYASQGWKVGKVPMRDWRAACVTWQKRHGPAHPPEPRVRPENDRSRLRADELSGDRSPFLEDERFRKEPR